MKGVVLLAQEYSYEEAVDKVLELANKIGTMPTKRDYEKYRWFLDVEGLADALDVRQSMARNNVRAYAAVNIAVLREVRRRNGEVVHIAEANEDTVWENSTSNFFARQDP